MGGRDVCLSKKTECAVCKCVVCECCCDVYILVKCSVMCVY